MTETAKERVSGFELLRIVAMVMIVTNHLINHGILKVASNDPYTLWKSGSFINRVLCAMITSGGRVGVAVFFMISGFFLANQERISVKSLKEILGRIHFFGAVMVGYLLILTWTVGYGKEYNLTAAVRKCLCIPATVWWFAFAYIVLLFLAPSLNRVIEFLRHGWLLFALILYIWIFFYTKLGDYSYDDFIKAVFFYLIGAWIRRTFGPAEKTHILCASLLFCICLVCWILAGRLSWIVLSQETNSAAVGDYGFFLSAGELLNQVIIPLFAMFMVLLFRELHFFSSIVNRIAGCTFGVYLFHDYFYTRGFLWHTMLKVDTVQYFSHWFPAFIMLDTMIVFMIGIVLELFRERLIQTIKSICCRIVGYKALRS